jgi:uncharacterized protein YjiS (DUF1127 family)
MRPLVDADMRHAARWLVLRTAWLAVAGMASRIAAWHRQRRQFKHTVGALWQLSDHSLKDIGIHRSQIRSIARSGRDLPRG